MRRPGCPQKTLEDANIKVTRVISNLLGTSGRALLRAWIAGETDPERLLAHTTGRLRAPRARLLAGLRGNVTDHHRFLLRVHLHQVEALEGLLAELDGRITEMLRPFRDAVERLTTVPGISTSRTSGSDEQQTRLTVISRCGRAPLHSGSVAV